MQARVHLYVRRYRDGRYTLRVIGHSRFCVYGDKIAELRDELRDVLAQELALGDLVLDDTDFVDGLEPEVVELDLRAVEHERLVRVPMRFLVLHRTDEAGVTDVWVPNLELRFRVRGEDERRQWTEERLRGHFHLASVGKLLEHGFAKHERVETLVVRFHGAGRYKLEQRRRQVARRDLEWTNAGGGGGALVAAGIELVEEARRGRLPRALGRDREVDLLVEVLAGRQGRAAVLRGPAGAGKTAVVQELAHRIAAGRVPDVLKESVLWQVSGNRLLAGLPFLGQWQERVLEVVAEMQSNGGILFGDALLELAMAGADAEESTSVAGMLEPFVRDDAIRLVVEATDEAWSRSEALSPGLARALRRVDVPSMTPAKAMEVMGILAARKGRQQDTTVTPEALQRAFELLARFGGDEGLPGSGLALLDQMIRMSPGRTLRSEDAVEAFCRASGFPAVLVDPARTLDEAELRGWFASRVIGQPNIVRALTDLVLVVKAGLSAPGRPLAGLLLVGPTGVGKTESAKALATWLFGDTQRLVRFDMSEFAGEGASWRLMNGPQSLIAAVRENPFSVVLLDEIEKADSSVFDVLLQVLDEGRLTDGQGRLTSFKHTVILMTSNLGASERRAIGPQDAEDPARRYLAAAEGFFRPEFVNRLSGVVPFGPLDREAVATIARGLLSQAVQRQGLVRRGIEVTSSEAVLELLMRDGYDVRYGARPMKRELDRHVVEPLARALVQGVTGPLRLEVVDGKVCVVPGPLNVR